MFSKLTHVLACVHVSFSWLSKIPLCGWTVFRLYPFIRQWTRRLFLPFSCCKQWGYFYFILLMFIYLALPSLSCGPRDLDLVPDQGSYSGPTALGVQSLSHWTTREVLRLLFKKILFILNWRIIALQYRVGFCHISAWIIHRYTSVPSLLNVPSTSHPIPPL